MLYDDVEFSGGAALKVAVLEMEAYPYHMHKDVLEIVFTLEGAVELTVVNNVLRMEEGDIYICSSNELHCLQAIEGTENLVLLLHVNLSIYKPEFPDINTYQFANSAIERNRTGVQILGSYLKKQLPRFMAGERADLGMLREIGDNILRILIREFQCYNLGKGYPEFNKTYRDNEVQLGRVRRISDYIYANYNQPIKVEDAAATEHISANHLTHIMKNGTGVSFRTFLNLARVEKSATLLLENEKSLQAVAYECGFSKYKYFAASFEKSFRMSPQQYRERYKDRTIFRQRGRFRQLKGEELETWLKSLSGTREELFLDLSQPRRESAFFKPGCVNLWGFRYDHVTDFPLLRDLRKKMSFETIGIDDDFLRRYRSSPRAMSYILTDFQTLQVGLRIHISSRTTPQLLEDFLCRLESLWERPVPGMAEFFISTAEPEDAQARRLKRMVERRGIAARLVEERPPLAGNLIYDSGYMPCFLLRSLAEGDPMYMDRITLLEGHGAAGEKGGFSLFTERGLKKPVYHLLSMMGKMGSRLAAQGNMYFASQTPGGEDFQILFYHYDKSFDPLFLDPVKARQHIDFLDLMARNCDNNRSVSVHVDHIQGQYALRKYRLSPEDYVSKYKNAPFLSCEKLSEETLRVLNATLSPEEGLTMLEPKGRWHLELELRPFEVVLLSFEKL